MSGPALEVRERRLPVASLVITAVLMAVFAWGWIEAAGWTLRSALYPRLISALGLALGLLQLVTLLRRSKAPVDEPVEKGVQLAGVTVLDDDEAQEQDVEYVFAHAGRRAWTEALAWVALFFGGLYVAGLYIAVPLFCLAYLRLVARTSWVVAVGYAAVAFVVLYVPFTYFLRVPVPEGLLG